MADKTIQTLKYALSTQGTSISTAATFTSADIGEDTGKCQIMLREMNVDLNPGQAWIEQRKATGRPNWSQQTGFESIAGTQLPTTSWPIDFNSYNLKPILWGFFQQGATEGATPGYPTTFQIFDEDVVAPTCEVWLSLVKQLTTTTNNMAIHGAIPKTITLEASEGDTLHGTVEFMGHTFTRSLDLSTTAGAGITPSEKAPLLWQNATVELDGNAVYMPNFSLTLNNNAYPQYFDSQTPIKYLLAGGNGYEGTGEFFVTYGDSNEGGDYPMTDYLAGTTHSLEVYWGADAAATLTAGQFATKFYIQKTSAEDADHNGEYGKKVSFKIVEDGTNEPITIIAADGIDRSIPA